MAEAPPVNPTLTPPPPPPSATTGIAVTGSAVSLVPTLQWFLKAMSWPEMDVAQAGGAIVAFALLAHGFVKLVSGVTSWAVAMRAAKAERLARRVVFTPEERAKVTGAAVVAPVEVAMVAPAA